MAHWGWYWKVKLKHTPKRLCSEVNRLDLFELRNKIPQLNHKDSRLMIVCETLNIRQSISHRRAL